MQNRKCIQESGLRPDTPTDKPVVWSNTIIDFSIKINNLYFIVGNI